MKKKKILLEIIIVIIMFIGYIYKVLIPELKEEYGSSDKFMNPNLYQSMIELKIEDQIDFAMVINKSNQLYHLFFFEKNSICLYDQAIEDTSIEIALDKIFSILMINNYIQNNTTITLIKYDNISYEKVYEIIKSLNQKYQLNLNIKEEESTLEQKRQELQLRGNNQESILTEMDYYSKGITGIGSKKSK